VPLTSSCLCSLFSLAVAHNRLSGDRVRRLREDRFCSTVNRAQPLIGDEWLTPFWAVIQPRWAHRMKAQAPVALSFAPKTPCWAEPILSAGSEKND
jgi:hypothetical protein